MMKKRTQIWHWLHQKERIIWLEYSILAFIIMMPLLPPGYILTLDLAFTPSFSLPSELTNIYPLEMLLWLLHFTLPGDIIEKIILFLILLLSGVGMHHVITSIKIEKSVSSDLWRWAAYFAGIFYMINPFTYSRFMAGQWMVLLGYVLLPFLLSALLKLVSQPGLRQATKTALWIVGISIVSLHHFGIALLLTGLVVVVGAARSPGVKKKQLAKYAGLAVGISIVLTSFWWVPALLGLNSTGQAVRDFNQGDAVAFASQAHGSLGVIGDVIRLQGFWAEKQQLFILPQQVIPAWGVVVLLLWLLVIFGAVKAWQLHRTLVLIACGCIVVGSILAATPLVAWLVQSIPLLGAYREPHKFANLIVIGYAILGAWGVAYFAKWIGEKWGNNLKQSAVVVGVALPLVVTPTMFWGFAGQLTPRHYPPEWYEMNTRLKEKTLFLPWHQYMKYGFSGRIIANPADKFFTAPTVASDDPEFKNVSSTIPNEEKMMIGNALKEGGENLTNILQHYDIERILLAKEDDYKKYDFLDHLEGLSVVTENDRLKLYKIEDKRP